MGGSSTTEPRPNGVVPDAGLRALDHYKTTLPGWRYQLRQSLLPVIRRETPYLASIQRAVRAPALDSYFAITANLGTHTFFTLLLPLSFWFGVPAFGKALVHILSGGVFFTGMIKDLYSLPRPLSPPLHRITMSGSAALEYGFPSTHSANAVSVAVYSLLVLRRLAAAGTLGAVTAAVLEALAYVYAATIVFGRIYCGMHGFLDVIVGGAVGGAIALGVFYWGPVLDTFMHASSWVAPFLAAAACVFLVWVHPEPADDCPCFDDSVAVAGVVIGVETGTWSHGRLALDPWTGSVHGGVPPPVTLLPPLVIVARLLLGFAVIFAWRGTVKPALLRMLPRLFRLGARLGLTSPRRFFVQADDYASVPSPRGSRIDNTFPQVSDLPRMVESIRHPQTRGRSVSVGPQSAADAYETLAYRERQRRESAGGAGGEAPAGSGPRKRKTENGSAAAEGDAGGAAAEAREVFSQLAKSRVRYDVEVVTKLVVYTGIAGLASALIPLLFEVVGLGTNPYRQS